MPRASSSRATAQPDPTQSASRPPRPVRASRAAAAASPPVTAPVHAPEAATGATTRVRKAPAKRNVTRAPAVTEPTTQGRNGATGRRSPAPRRRAVRRVGIMGGTFDPIHHGHLVAASEVASRFLLDEVIFVPTGRPWQKATYDVSTAEDRYLMTVIATASNPRFSVSRVDIDRDGPTYTVDTLRDMKSFFGPKADLFFITGADALDKILSWKDADQVFELAHFVGVTRPGFVLSDEHLPEATVSLVQVPAMAISSTDCRARVAAGLPVWYLVPDGVVQYINKRQLYR